MLTNLSLIGGSDGPTSIFLAGKMNFGWMNVFGLIIIVLFLIPNIIYRVKVKNYQKLYANKFMKILEQIGQYGCMFLMVFDFGMGELGFGSIEAFLVYIFGNVDTVDVIFYQGSILEKDYIGSDRHLSVSVKWNNNDVHSFDYIWYNIWNRTYIHCK